MNLNDPNNLNDSGEAALDRLLAEARWEMPIAADEYRLREEWMYLRRRRRMIPMFALAVAASVAIVVAMSAMMRTEPVQVASVKMLVTEGSDSPAPEIESRPATPYEMLIAMQAGSQVAVSSSVNPSTPKLDSKTQKLVNQLGDPLVERRYEAAKELANFEQPQVVPILTAMVENGVNRREALAALMWSKDPLAARALAEVRMSQTVNAQLLALKIELQ